jgi:hypothetical protein
MKKSENPAKLLNGCKKGLKNVSSSQNIRCLHAFVSKGHIKGQNNLEGFEGGGCTVGYISPWTTTS